MDKDQAFVHINKQDIAKVRLASGEIQVVPRFGMSNLWMDRENETATLTYQDGTTYELKPLTFKEAFS